MIDGIVQIMVAGEYHRQDYNEMSSTVYGLMSKCNIDKVYIDGANHSFIKSLKLQIGEEADYDQVIARYRSEGLGDATKDMKIVSINFNKEHKAMLENSKMILENDGGRIAINPDRFDNLITALRTAVDNDGHTTIYLMLSYWQSSIILKRERLEHSYSISNKSAPYNNIRHTGSMKYLHRKR
jgi:aromatic ring-cleaving dioxygenase